MSAIRNRNIAKLQTKYAIHQESMEYSSTKKRKLLYRRLTVFFVIAGVISFFMGSTYLNQLSALEEKEREKKELEHQFSSLKKQQQIYKEEIIKLNDDDYIAKLARKEYFLSENNEIIFNLPEDSSQKSSE